MKGVQKLAASVAASRKPVAADNRSSRCRRKVLGNQIIAALDAYRVARDGMAEQTFFQLLWLAIRASAPRPQRRSEVRQAPGTSPRSQAAHNPRRNGYAAEC